VAPPSAKSWRRACSGPVNIWWSLTTHLNARWYNLNRFVKSFLGSRAAERILKWRAGGKGAYYLHHIWLVVWCFCWSFSLECPFPTISKKIQLSFGILSFCAPLRVSRVVCGAISIYSGPWANRVLSQLMLHWWRANGSAAREHLPRPALVPGHCLVHVWWITAARKGKVESVVFLITCYPAVNKRNVY